jgi:16S rRNA processing protein RimM
LPNKKSASAAKSPAKSTKRAASAAKSSSARRSETVKAPAKTTPRARTAKSPAPQAPAKPAKAGAKASAKPAAKAPAKPAAKTAPTPAAKPKAAPAPKVAAKPAAEKPADKKTAAKSAAAPKAKPAPKPEPVKPEPKPEPKAGSVKKAAKAKPAKPVPPPPAPKPPRIGKAAPASQVGDDGPRSARPLAAPPKPLAKTKPAPLAAPKPAPETIGEEQPVPTFKGKAASGSVSPNTLVMVGAVSGAFGVKGEVRIRSFTEKREGVVSYGPLHGGDGKILLRPKSWRELRDGVAITAPEVKTREAAEKMKGVRLFVPRANLPEAAEDEFYWVDLMGCHAEAVDGAPMGEVVAVWNFGAGDILELKPPNGGQNIQISFTKQNVPLVDRDAKRIVIDPPAPEPTS